MKSLSSKLAIAFALLAAGTLRVAALDHGVVIASPDVPAAALTPAALKDILTGKTAYWEGGQAIVIVSLGEKSDAALQEACDMSAAQFKTFWQRLAFSGRGQQPKVADDADKAAALVAGLKGAIAIVPPDSKLTGVKKIDIK
jgi:ABC-type phosphate transport system substrate-binding protein